MPRAPHPSAPADDLQGLAKSIGRGRRGILTEELAAFCESGVSVVMGAKGEDGRPVAGRALACRIASSGLVTLYLQRPLNLSLLQAVKAGSGLAVTFTRPKTHRSIQLKSDSAREAAAPKKERDWIEAQLANFRGELIGVEYSETFASDYCAADMDDVTAIAFSPRQAFVQTPGPGAGSALPL